MECGNISVLFINDFDKGFTPVLECEIANLKMINSEYYSDEKTEVEMYLPLLTANYFNLELGEWEPLLEQFSLKAEISETVSLKIISATFAKPVYFNLTQECLRNFVFTQQSWNATTPEFLIE